jgi:hypothetical protein
VVGVTGGQAASFDMGHGAFVRGSVLRGEAAAQDEAVGAEGVGGAAQRGRVAVAGCIVRHPASGRRRLLRVAGASHGNWLSIRWMRIGSAPPRWELRIFIRGQRTGSRG